MDLPSLRGVVHKAIGCAVQAVPVALFFLRQK